VIADALGRAIAFRISPGQAHELPQALPLLDSLPGVPMWVVGDRGYTSHAFREHVWNMGARPAIPPQRHEALVACPTWDEAVRTIGDLSAAAAVIYVLQLYDDDVASGRNRIRNAGGYYRSIVRMISRGDINLQSELLAMRRRKLV
jgi:transposase